ncbi:hypothetical protein PHYBLDRAFT_151806 [Phycomyces blakesleeanus NRRL 1555(-)]|uniref:Uncharacterized protein n=2 Tax=Phycomyces blakesleeanus TaxID=4837 RepID=A0A167K3H0_PHYB8|nr:hypothetical protein PHYBLDRAFT_151806 [Phycomyces blakesleeanus NRRL 1555(-)]OAD67198.1 hypothetical protein PHYBLDRAFT_151806 [Phycomyces blakesleeanus NRRL 1555(-)]|eukprot:XP_018285238.1 hypothetical protein PHYBLDRAFT_151806 [Phycomyces blakesleeanus NRRL 1555(-)]
MNEIEREQEDQESLIIPGFQFLINFTLDVFKGTLMVLKPIISVIMAVLAIMLILSYCYRVLSDGIMDIVCPIGFLGSLVPSCQNHLMGVPDFTHFVKAQESLYETMLTQNNADAISALELKKVELATRDLQVMIKYSTLVSADIMDAKLKDYLVRSRRFGRDIQSLQAQTKGVIDNLITYNTFTIKKLSDVESRKSSRQELRKVYESAMGLVEKEAKRLILAIEKAQGSLDELEEDLYAIHEISVQEKNYQRSEIPHLLADLLNLVNGKGLQRPLVDENLALLTNFDAERAKASKRLVVMLDRMESFQMDLEELRTQVVAPVVAPDIIPLEMHIENIGKAIERLKSGKVISWEERAQLD